MVRAFAECNGWYSASRCFRPYDIGKQIGNTWFDGMWRGQDREHEFRTHEWFDHGPLCFRQKLDGHRWRNIAIVGQPYDGAFESEDGRVKLDAYCTRHGLKMVLPPNPKASFYYPGAAMFVVITLPEVEVKWLPEQARAIVFRDTNE